MTLTGSYTLDPRSRVNSADQQSSPVRSTCNVLVAEDEVLVRLMLADALRKNGFQVFEATDANEAMSILNAMPLDVVVTDMQMHTPRDGLDLAKYVRAHHPAVCLLLSSAHALPVGDVGCFDAFFLKPYDPEQIVRWIELRLTSSLGHEDTGVA